MDIKQAFRLFLRRWWLFAVSAAIMGGITFYVNFFLLAPIYEANASIYVNSKEFNTTDYGIAYDQVLVNTQLIADYTELMKSRTVAEAVVDDLGLTGMTSKDIIHMVSVSSKNGTRIMEITATSSDPVLAMNVANSLAVIFSKKAVELMSISNVNIIDPAKRPENPIGPKKAANIVMSVFIAFVIAAGLAIAFEYFDNTIKTSEDVENRLGLTVLGTIPDLKMK